jgi:hypothetical protein
MKEFLEDHFTPILLAFLAIAAWIGPMHLIHTPGIAAEDKGWAREEVGILIGALIMVLTGQVAKLASKKDAGPPPAELPEPSNEKNKADEPSV